MTNESSIKYLSCLLDSPATINDGDQSSIRVFKQTFPYFVPIRYVEAVESYKRDSLSPEMLTSLYPYMGNWIQFCDFLEAGNRDPVYVSDQQSTTSGNEDFFQLIQREVPETEEETERNTIIQEEEQLPDTIAEEPVTQQSQAPEPENVYPTEHTDNDTEIEHDITADIPATVEEPEQIVALSDSFLQLIRAEGLESDEDPVAEKTVEPVHADPISIVPQPVFESYTEETSMPIADIDETIIITTHTETEAVDAEEVSNNTEEQNPLIYPIYTQDYFLQQGEKVPDEMPAEIGDLIENGNADDEDKSLMVVMSFSEWLLHFKNTSKKQEEEKKDQKALKTMWQKEKLAAAIEEENEEIPENVFEMAVNSIAKEDGLASESLADIYIKQGKYDKAIDMFKKLSLRNPQKNAYFARKIEEVLKDKQS